MSMNFQDWDRNQQTPKRIDHDKLQAAIKERERQLKQEEQKRAAEAKREKRQSIIDKIKNRIYGILHIFLLFGVPLIICIVLWLLFNWNDALKIIAGIKDVGFGTYFLLLMCCILSALSIWNIFVAFIHMLEYIGNKLKPVWCYTYLIVTILGIIATLYLIVQGVIQR